MTDDLLARHRAVLPSWMPVYYDEPIELVSGSGSRVTDADGRTYLDFFGGVLTNMLGYDIAEVREAVRAPAAHRDRAHLDAVPDPPAGRAGREDRPAVRHPGRARCSSPTPAPRPTRPRCCSPPQYRRSNQVLAVRNSYHGRSYAAIGITGNRGWSASQPQPGQRELPALRRPAARPVRAACPTPSTSPPPWPTCARCSPRTTAGDVACLIAEPIQGVGGFVHAAGRAASARSRRCSTSTASCSSPTRCRPAGGAPASTSGGTRRTASCPT